MGSDKKTLEVSQVEKDAVGNISVTIENKTPIKAKLKKYTGEYIQGDAPATLYMATRKEMMLFMNESEYIQFKNNAFRTNDARLKQYIQLHEAFDKEIFAEKFPKYNKDKMEEYRKYVTKDPEVHKT